jgi:hypothetical protein
MTTSRRDARRWKPPPDASAAPVGATDPSSTRTQLDEHQGIDNSKVVKGDPAARFWARVQKTATCWLWTGETRSGYGRFAIYEGGRRRRINAHRWIYGQVVAPLVNGLEVEHLCHTPLCVRPGHLDQVTPWENQKRGFSPWAINARKTRCEHGHPLTDEANLYRRPDGRGYQCRECIRIRRATHRAKLRQVRRAA